MSWFLTLDDLVPLEQIPQHYGLHFSEEHGFRFWKQDLLWTAAHVRTADQFLLWSWMVALAFTQLYLAYPLGGQRPSADSTADPPGHAHAFVAAWHTRPCVSTTRKIARARQRLPSQTGDAPPDDLQNEQQEEKERKGHGNLSLRCLSFSFELLFLRPEPCT